MTNITGLDELTNILSGGGSGSAPQHIFMFEDSFVGTVAAAAPVANQLTSLWQYNGSPAGEDIIPTATVVYPTNTSTGSIGQLNAIGANGELWLLSVSSAGSALGSLLLYDRLAYMGGLSGIVTSTQIVSASALTRYTGSMSVGNRIFVEVYTLIGATATFVMATYKNQNGQISVTPSASIGGTGLREAQRMVQLPLASGDTGVTEVMGISVSPSTGTAGNFGVTIAHPICWLPNNTFGGVRDLVLDLPSIIKIEPNATLAVMFLANSTTTIQQLTSLKIIEK